MLRTMSHEMIHMAKQMSPGYFERYSDFIFDNFLSENADELIFRRQRQYEKANNGKKLSYNEAMEEVVADASEMFLKGFLGLKVELGNQAGEGRVGHGDRHGRSSEAEIQGRTAYSRKCH